MFNLRSLSIKLCMVVRIKNNDMNGWAVAMTEPFTNIIRIVDRVDVSVIPLKYLNLDLKKPLRIIFVETLTEMSSEIFI